MYVVFCDRFQVWKPVLILEGRFEKGCGIWHFLPGVGGGGGNSAYERSGDARRLA